MPNYDAYQMGFEDGQESKANNSTIKNISVPTESRSVKMETLAGGQLKMSISVNDSTRPMDDVINELLGAFADAARRAKALSEIIAENP